jgi:hypothetical protein
MSIKHKLAASFGVQKIYIVVGFFEVNWHLGCSPYHRKAES